ncbi:unnamed protein product [Prunus armeniaca]
MRFTSTAEKDPNSSTRFDEEPKHQSPSCGQEMDGIAQDIKEQIWEDVQMAYVVRQWGKKMVLSSAGKK